MSDTATITVSASQWPPHSSISWLPTVVRDKVLQVNTADNASVILHDQRAQRRSLPTGIKVFRVKPASRSDSLEESSS